ncbi:hypothetical protein AAG906_031387 [Vitis piasezkii]|uniref:peptidyl-prolyl cis-trans isomerase FKBP17-1, chloroplastic n=1 Tax=Vitis riparia TaxID=96939 RepID=UPI00155A43A5|nr:peptidyl-prolyl cis-trans isomerase FKBP17-1, chloroplastic [Vitis riparia]
MTKMVIIRWCAPPPALLLPHHPTARFSSPKPPSVVYAKSSSPASSSTTRRALSLSLIFSSFTCSYYSSSEAATSEFFELQGSGGVKALDLRTGSGEVPVDGDQVAVHYYGRLAAKQGWRFDSTYDHKDETGEPIPFVFTLGSGKVISGIEAAVRSMKVGSIRRVIIPPSQGYQNTSQEPIPPNFFDRQRLFTTIFNPTRLANGEGSTLGTLIFDIELVSLKHP